MINIKAFAPIMFAWIYKKDDLWVIGTGAEDDLHGYADRFYDHVCRTYNFTGRIERKEAFASALKNGVNLGQGNVLLCGDAAGLLDPYRGVAMDNAALSARFAVKAILNAAKTGSTAISRYATLMQPMIRQLEANEMKRQAKFMSDETLAESMAPGRMLVDGVKMMAANAVNRFLPPERVFTFPF
jgi:flavin-dependent dehydrogenase